MNDEQRLYKNGNVIFEIDLTDDLLLSFSYLITKNYITSITCGVGLATIHMVTERRIAFTFASARLSIIWHGTSFRAIKLIISIGTSWKNNKNHYTYMLLYYFDFYYLIFSYCVALCSNSVRIKSFIYRFNDITKMSRKGVANH